MVGRPVALLRMPWMPGGDVGACRVGKSAPADCAVRSLLTPVRSAGQDSDAVCAGCAVVGGVCVCDLSAPPGAEANALAGMQ